MPWQSEMSPESLWAEAVQLLDVAGTEDPFVVLVLDCPFVEPMRLVDAPDTVGCEKRAILKKGVP